MVLIQTLSALMYQLWIQTTFTLWVEDNEIETTIDNKKGLAMIILLVLLLMRKWYSKITNVHTNEFENDKRRKSNNEKKTWQDHAAKLIDDTLHIHHR